MAKAVAMDAAAVKRQLYSRHPATWQNGSTGIAPGQWTCIEEWMNIDLLAWNAWGSGGPSYGRVGYEVKVSRSDYRSELLKPHKRARQVAWCHEFYFAVPRGLLRPDELAYVPPPVLADPGAYVRVRCPGYYGAQCTPTGPRRQHQVWFGKVPWNSRHYSHGGYVEYQLRGGGTGRHFYSGDRSYAHTCPTCGGKGYVQPSIAERIAPTLWIPADVGLVEVWPGGTRMVRRSPRRHQVPDVHPAHLAQLVRWVSARPDPRHRNISGSALAQLRAE